MKTLKKLTSVLTAILVVVGLFATVTNAKDSIIEVPYGETPQVGLTKAVTTGTGTTELPELTYTFKVEQIKDTTISFDGSGNAGIPDGAATTTGQPKAYYQIETEDLPIYPNTDATLVGITTVKPGVTTATSSDSATDYYKKQSSNFFDADFLDSIKAPTGKGIYAYYITEELTLNDDEVNAWGATKKSENVWEKEAVNEGEYTETLTLSKAKYVMFVYTKVDPNDSTKGYISAITCAQVQLDDGTYTVWDEVEKKDITLGTEGVGGTFSEMEFKNNIKKVLKTDPNAEQPFELHKRVTGVDQDEVILHGDAANNVPAKAFKFDVTLIKADGDPATSYVGKVYNSIQGTGAVTPWEATGTTYTFEFNDPANPNKATVEVELAHNQKLAFAEVPAGTQFDVVEHDYFTGVTLDADNHVYPFKPAIDGGTLPTDEAMEDTDQNLAARTALTKTVPANGTVNTIYENNGNVGTTPAGIISNYLPFFAIILLAVVALAGSAIVKGSRRAHNH